MIASDYGIKVMNFVGKYEIINYNDTEYIVSKEFYPACEDEVELEIKTLFVEDFNKNNYLYIALANVNIKKDEEIIAYCNQYGLPLSSMSILEICDPEHVENTGERIDEEDEFVIPLERHDYMEKNEFCRCVVNIKNLMEFKRRVDKKIYDEETALLLIYLLIFNNMWKFNEAQVYDLNKPITKKICIPFQSHIYDNAKFIKILNSQKFEKINFTDIINCFDKQKIITQLAHNIPLSSNNYADKIFDFLFYHFFEKNDASKIFFDSALNITCSDDIVITDEMIKLMKEISPRVLTESITDGVSEVRPELSMDACEKYKIDWRFTQQIEGAYMQMFLTSSFSDSLVRKCHNSNCGKFFPVNYRNDQKYCCHNCAVATAKRRQRAKDKEDPNRQRLQAKFQSKKGKK